MTHYFEKGLEAEERESAGVILFFVSSHTMTHCRIQYIKVDLVKIDVTYLALTLYLVS